MHNNFTVAKITIWETRRHTLRLIIFYTNGYAKELYDLGATIVKVFVKSIHNMGQFYIVGIRVLCKIEQTAINLLHFIIRILLKLNASSTRKVMKSREKLTR